VFIHNDITNEIYTALTIHITIHNPEVEYQLNYFFCEIMATFMQRKRCNLNPKE